MGRAAGHNERLDGLGNLQHFENAAAAAKPGHATGLAGARFIHRPAGQLLHRKSHALEARHVGRLHLAAVGTEPAHETLGHHAGHSRGHQERFDPHIEQTRKRAGGIICMQRAEHEMAGQGGLDRDFRGFGIPDFTHHDDIGVLAQEGAQRVGKRQADIRAHQHLVDTAHLILNRLLGGQDAPVDLVDFVQEGVERGRFSRTGGTRHQDDPVGAVDVALDQLFVARRHPEIFQADELAFALQKTQADTLAVNGRHGRYADIDVLALHAQSDTPVHGHAFLGDIQVGHDLDTRDDGGLEPDQAGRHRRLVQNTVDPVANTELRLHRFHMNIRRALLHRFPDDLVHELDNRGLLVELGHIDLGQGLIHGHLEAVVLHHAVDRLGTDPVESLGGLGDIGRRTQGQLDPPPGGQAQAVDQPRIEGVV